MHTHIPTRAHPHTSLPCVCETEFAFHLFPCIFAFAQTLHRNRLSPNTHNPIRTGAQKDVKCQVYQLPKWCASATMRRTLAGVYSCTWDYSTILLNVLTILLTVQRGRRYRVWTSSSVQQPEQHQSRRSLENPLGCNHRACHRWHGNLNLHLQPIPGSEG